MEAAVMTGMMEAVEMVKEVTESGADWEVEQIKGMDSEETLLTMVELGTEVTVVRGHPSIPLLPLSLAMSIGISHGLYTYPTTSIPLRPPRDNRRSSSISRYLTIQPT
jgi:hypothetical protein